jgi:hypothetical protein
MALAVVRSRGLNGVAAPEVTVEVHLANGLPSFTLVGLPDTEVREARERVRAALQNSRFDFPTRRITVNLGPADLPKESGRFDLPIALGILAASDQLPGRALDAFELRLRWDDLVDVFDARDMPSSKFRLKLSDGLKRVSETCPSLSWAQSRHGLAIEMSRRFVSRGS